MIITYEGREPVIGSGVFVAPTATVIGAVTIGDTSSVYYGAVLRGDMERITIGEASNIQDNCTLHTDFGFPVVIGNRVTVGHNAVIHGCTLEDGCLIGMGAVVQNGARIGRGAVVAVGSVVRIGQQVPPGYLVAGIPAQIKKPLDDAALAKFYEAADDYLEILPRHRRLFSDT
ncbi:MAG: gamma carbonic anhydrase family protein [Pseudomonadota bacterium]